MSWKLTRDEILKMLVAFPERAPLKGPIDAFDAQLCQSFGAESRRRVSAGGILDLQSTSGTPRSAVKVRSAASSAIEQAPIVSVPTATSNIEPQQPEPPLSTTVVEGPGPSGLEITIHSRGDLHLPAVVAGRHEVPRSERVAADPVQDAVAHSGAVAAPLANGDADATETHRGPRAGRRRAPVVSSTAFVVDDGSENTRADGVTGQQDRRVETAPSDVPAPARSKKMPPPASSLFIPASLTLPPHAPDERAGHEIEDGDATRTDEATFPGGTVVGDAEATEMQGVELVHPDVSPAFEVAQAEVGIAPVENALSELTQAEVGEASAAEGVPSQVQRDITEKLADDEEPSATMAEQSEVEELVEIEEVVDERAASDEGAAAISMPPTPPPEAKRKRAWFDDVFGEHFLEIAPPRSAEAAASDANFLKAAMSLESGASILDVGCGNGRHAVALGRQGFDVVGLDTSPSQLLAAEATLASAEEPSLSVTFVQGDMRSLPDERLYDSVVCLGTSLGYFEDEQNRACMEGMKNRLRPGGRIAVQVFNRDFVAHHLPCRSWWQGRRCMVLDEAEMNFFANRLRVHRTVIFEDGRQFEHHMFIRAFSVHDLGKMMSSVGLKVLEVSGSRETRGRFYGADSPEIWMIGERRPG